MSIEATEPDPRKLVVHSATAETPQIITNISPSLKDENVRVYGISDTGLSTLISSDYWSFNSTRTELTLQYTSDYANVLILIDPVVEQPLEYTRDTSFLPSVLERQLDQLTLMASWTRDALARSLQFPESEGAPPSGDLGSASDRADMLLGFDTDGSLLLRSSASFIGPQGPAGEYPGGFVDYNDTTGDIALTSDTWTDVPNNGLGSFTNTTYIPEGVTSVMDNSTGYLDFTDLDLGQELRIRNDFIITPNTNNALLQVRYVLGGGLGEYTLLHWSERLDSGSGIDYQRVISFPIYMGDANTRDNPGKLQVKLSAPGTLNNNGSYISIT